MRIHAQTSHQSEAVNILFKAALPAQSRVVVGTGCLGGAARILEQLNVGKTALLLCQPSVRQQFAEPLGDQLSVAGYNIKLEELPDGEACKSHEVLLRVWELLQQMQFKRSDVLVAVGGGALTDLAGFAAATYLRGIKLVLVPTTLLSQVDAAIGGKTGINLPSGKNLAGSFFFPEAVLVDPDVLRTLPERELRSGLGEIIKYALIEETVTRESDYRRGPRSLWSLLKDALHGADAELDEGLLSGIVAACIRMKLAVVAKDPYEQRLRRCLNLGHTLGHAIEKVTNFSVTHGEAVAIGTVFACRLAEKLNGFDPGETDTVRTLLQAAGLPVEIPSGLDKQKLLQAITFDKKRQGAGIAWVLPHGKLGNVQLDVIVSSEKIEELL